MQNHFSQVCALQNQFPQPAQIIHSAWLISHTCEYISGCSLCGAKSILAACARWNQFSQACWFTRCSTISNLEVCSEIILAVALSSRRELISQHARSVNWLFVYWEINFRVMCAAMSITAACALLNQLKININSRVEVREKKMKLIYISILAERTSRNQLLRRINYSQASALQLQIVDLPLLCSRLAQDCEIWSRALRTPILLHHMAHCESTSRTLQPTANIEFGLRRWELTSACASCERGDGESTSVINILNRNKQVQHIVVAPAARQR